MPPRPPLALLVEDDADIRDALSEFVSGNGWSVLGAADGEEALRVMREGARPSAVFLDRGLPRLDGRAVLDAMRADPALAGIPVVWMSGDPGGAPPGTAHRLEKPFEVDRLVAILQSLCDASS